MPSLEHHEIVKLAAWVRKAHAAGKHAIVLLDQYDPVEVSSQIRLMFDAYDEAGALDTIIGDRWLNVRQLMARVPMALFRNPDVVVCTITP